MLSNIIDAVNKFKSYVVTFNKYLLIKIIGLGR